MRAPMNKLHVNPTYCKGCLICVEACPTKAIQPCKAINAQGYILPEEDDMRRCTGCRLCETVCPDFAIAIETDEDQGG
jgi:2-oxoglutarate ferredoxin oxidoreductase subunit delta